MDNSGHQFPVFRNQNLFKDHYLADVLPMSDLWTTDGMAEVKRRVSTLWEQERSNVEEYNEHQLEHHFIRPVLNILGHVYEVQAAAGGQHPDYAFFRDEEARTDRAPDGSSEYWANALAVGDAKRWDRPLDKRLTDGRGWDFQNPSFQVLHYLTQTGCPWAILTNGRLWRLYSAEPKPDMEVYHEVDLPALLQSANLNDFACFWLFFRREAFEPDQDGKSFLRRVREESDLAAAAVLFHRKMHGDRKKIDGRRADYYDTTIDKAGDSAWPRGVLTDPDADRGDRIKAIASELDVPLTDIQKVTGPPGVFRFWAGEKCVEIRADQMQNQRFVAGRIYDLADRVARTFKERAEAGDITWRDMMRAMALAAEQLKGDKEITLDGEVIGIIQGWLQGRNIHKVERGTIIDHPDNPFIRDEHLWFRIECIRSWMRTQGIRMEDKELRRRLRALGAQRGAHKVKLSRDKQSTRSFYGIDLERVQLEE